MTLDVFGASLDVVGRLWGIYRRLWVTLDVFGASFDVFG